MWRMNWKLGLCLLALALVLPQYAESQGGVTYIYDQLGRLVGVVDPSGNAAVYSYDAVGNILSISRYVPGQVETIEFTPTSGPVGTTVTIWGIGFSSTASQDTVSFNGAHATVTSATATQITATVPSGATTGPIAVTSPSGSSTSTTSFTVGSPAGAPTITGFTPPAAGPGASVTITGTNFSTVPANNRVMINLSLAQVQSATATSITAIVPDSATSGRISVTTPLGTAVSTAYLFTPGGAWLGQTTMGGPSSQINLPSGGQALLAFDGVAGQWVSVNLTNGTFPTCGIRNGILYDTLIFILDPWGRSLAVAGGCVTTSGFLGPAPLPITATYTLLIYREDNSAGGIVANVYNATPFTSPITINGPSVNVPLSNPGQNGTLTFSATQGQSVTVSVTNNTISSCVVQLNDPNGNYVNQNSCSSGSSFNLGSQTLNVTGTYTINILPSPPAAGSMTVSVTSP